MADENRFSASARIPTRPLSIENKDMAHPKELIVDYVNHELYVMDEQMNLVNVTASVDTVIKEMEEKFKEDPSVITDIKIELPDGTSVAIDKSIYDIYTKYNDISNTVSSIGNGLSSMGGALSNHIDNGTHNASNITTSSNLQFVSAEEKNKWNEKTDIFQLTARVLSGDSNWTGESPYIQEISVVDMLWDYCPIVDVKLSEDYETAMKELDSYSYIYKILTYDGKIKVYATKPTEVDINIVIKIDK